MELTGLYGFPVCIFRLFHTVGLKRKSLGKPLLCHDRQIKYRCKMGLVPQNALPRSYVLKLRFQNAFSNYRFPGAFLKCVPKICSLVRSRIEFPNTFPDLFPNCVPKISSPTHSRGGNPVLAKLCSKNNNCRVPKGSYLGNPGYPSSYKLSQKQSDTSCPKTKVSRLRHLGSARVQPWLILFEYDSSIIWLRNC